MFSVQLGVIVLPHSSAFTCTFQQHMPARTSPYEFSRLSVNECYSDIRACASNNFSKKRSFFV